MDKLGDIDLFVRVIKNKGLAAAGREVGLSPARMTARINALEERYGVRLLHRTTRRVSLTDEGREFYVACEEILANVAQAEAQLQSRRDEFVGPLRVTCTVDLGRQYVASLLTSFVKAHPRIQPFLHLSDGITPLADRQFDLGIRYGVLSDSSMIAKRLAASHRVLCASPDYLRAQGTPSTPAALAEHDCLAMVRVAEPLTTWHFESNETKQSILIRPARSASDGALIRQWALEGAGIALKSVLDVADDLKNNRLVTVLDAWTHDFALKGTTGGSDLHVLYPSRAYLPKRIRGFIDLLAERFDALAASMRP